MGKYRAIVSITFDDDDLSELARRLEVHPRPIDALDAIGGSLDNLDFGDPWVEQVYKDRRPMISRMSSGIDVQVSDFED
jgi:hypothetical protein